MKTKMLTPFLLLTVTTLFVSQRPSLADKEAVIILPNAEASTTQPAATQPAKATPKSKATQVKKHDGKASKISIELKVPSSGYQLDIIYVYELENEIAVFAQVLRPKQPATEAITTLTASTHTSKSNKPIKFYATGIHWDWHDGKVQKIDRIINFILEREERYKEADLVFTTVTFRPPFRSPRVSIPKTSIAQPEIIHAAPLNHQNVQDTLMRRGISPANHMRSSLPPQLMKRLLQPRP